jgi:glycosyltransferase involved in cell wall biosynthesis
VAGELTGLRVLHVTPSFHPAWAYGGIPRCAYELCRELVLAGEDVTVWTTDALDRDHRIGQANARVDGIAVRRFANWSNRLAYDRQLYLPAGLGRAARREIGRFEVVHVHSHRNLPEVIAALAARRRGVPYVVTGNGTVPAIERYRGAKRVFDALGARRVLECAAACLAVSQAEVAHYRAAGVDAGRVHVIPNGIRPEDFAVLPERGTFRRAHGLGEGPLVVFVGKITPRKGVDVLLRALARLPASVRLVVGGNFMMPEEPVRRLAESLGVGSRVLFTGFLDPEARNAAYVDADVVAYPSVDEIFGLVAAEAFLCNAPVVVCDDSGCGELVAAAGGGLLVPYGDAEALARALDSFLGEAGRRAAAAESGRRFVLRNLTWAEIAARTRELYRKVVAAR